jgi:hypothetical protein
MSISDFSSAGICEVTVHIAEDISCSVCTAAFNLPLKLRKMHIHVHCNTKEYKMYSSCTKFVNMLSSSLLCITQEKSNFHSEELNYSSPVASSVGFNT